MSAPDDTIAYCHACGTAMDVSNVAPFSNVECPACQKHTRVKREFGPYTLLRRHAIGGMSMVFVGHDNTLDREVALKILSETYSADEKRISSFEEEARITAAISHPHVVRVFKTGKAFGRFYIAMEMVTGGHLEHQIKERGAIPESEALQLAIEVAEGLRSAHSAGLIHRDIKPGNILLDSAGSAKIVDFGLALMTKGGVATPDELWATPYYVPPETIEGREEDYRADVYAFGATFYHVLAGKPPCTEESMVTTQLREAKKHIVPLSIACPDLCLETAAVIECAMAYDPSARFRSYDELIESLQTALMVVQTRDKNLRKGIKPTNKPVPVAITPAERRRIAKRQTAQKMITASATVLVLGVAGWAAVKLLGGKEPTPLPIVVTNDPNATDVPVITDQSGVAINNLYQQARKLLAQGNYEAARESFLQLRDNGNVQEPTRTWCGFEAMLCAYLNGRSNDARADAKHLEQHLKDTSVPENIRQRLKDWLPQLQDYPPITKNIESDTPQDDLIFLMSTMTNACKNWEQGKMKEAIPAFELIKNATIKGNNSLIEVYQAKANNYLADAAKLQEHQLTNLPATPQDCRDAAENLEPVLATLATRGRAKFLIREWQLLLGRHAKALEETPQTIGNNAGPSFAEVMKKLPTLTANCQYLDAAELLKKTSNLNANEETQRTALLGMCEGAGIFLADLEEDISKAPITLAIACKDGRSFTTVNAASEGMVTLSNGDTEASLPWSEIPASNIINLYREVIRKNPGDVGVPLRHESAICFQWLSGEKDAAQTAANVLSNTSPSFKKRWEQWMTALK